MPTEFLQGEGYTDSAGEQRNYADVLLDSTNVILRESLRKILSEDLLHLFCDKAALNSYFERLRLIRKQTAASNPSVLRCAATAAIVIIVAMTVEHVFSSRGR